MAWPTPALDDLIWTHDTGGKRWLHALCTAVNERQIGLGLAQTKFICGDGSEASSIDLSDLTGVWVGGSRDGAITNLNRCMVAIKAMLTQSGSFGTIGSFLQTVGYGATAWTLSSLQADIGLGAFPNGTDRFTDLNFFKQMKEALDRMTICRKVSTANSGTVLSKQSAVGDPDPQVGWDAALVDTPSTAFWSGTSGRQVGWFIDGFQSGPFTGNYDIEFRNTGSTSFVNGCVGSLDEAYYVVLAKASTTSAPDWEIEPPGGSVISVANNFSGKIAGADLALSSSNVTEYRYSSGPPSTIPGTLHSYTGGYPPGGVFFGIYASLAMSYADFYFQPSLTDQA